MKRPVCKTTLTRYSGPRTAAGYTMVEILVATTLMLTIMLAVAWVFGMVGETIADSRSTLEMTGQLRSVAARLKQELDGVTVSMSMPPPRDPASDEGYFEITEGAIGPVVAYVVARNNDRNEVDTIVGDFDDILIFTTRSSGAPFVGRCVQKYAPVPPEVRVGMDATGDYAYNFATIESDVAEVAYFVRGPTLYRRVLLVKPNFPRSTSFGGNMDLRNDAVSVADPIYQLSPRGFYNNDVSIRQEWRCIDQTTSPPTWAQVMAANTLGDLTKRENRFAHRARITTTGADAGFPYHPHWWHVGNPDTAGNNPRRTFWGTYNLYTALGLPTLQECSHPDWNAGGPIPNPVNTTIIPAPTVPGQLPLTPKGVYDAWDNPHPYQQQDPTTGSLSYPIAVVAPTDPTGPPLYMGPRVGEDVVLTNVVGFDVKVWDPQAYVLPATDANGTYTNPWAVDYWTLASFTDDGVIPGVAVVPGDPGYRLALAHALVADDQGVTGVFSPLGYGAYVDLNYMYSMNIRGLPSGVTPAILKQRLLNLTPFAGQGEDRSQLRRVYDTWSTHYESNWLDSNLNGAKDTDATLGDDLGNEDRDYDTSGVPVIDEGTDGMDNDGNGAVDDALEQEAPAPYPVPLRGIQIKIRVFDTDSRQVREHTIVCDFLPK